MSGRYKAYGEYKASGVEWLGEIPERWICTQVKYGYDVTLGKMLQKTKGSSFEIIKPYLKAQNIQPTGIDLDKVDEMWFSDDERKKLLLRNNDVLVSEGGDVGRSALWKDQLSECYIQNAINRVRALKGNSSSYFNYWVFALKSADYINILCNKATIAHYTAEKLETTPQLLPTPDEQTQIAAFLDHETAKIDTLIDKQQQLIELLKEKRQAVISHAVTKGLDPDVPMKDSGVEWLGAIPEYWHINKMRYMFSFGKGLTITKENLKDEGIPCVNYGEVHSKFSFEVNPGKNFLKCVNPQYLITSQNSLLNKGDLVFADTSEDIEGSGNFTQLVSDDALFAGYHTIIARPHESKNSRFYAYLFDCSQLRSQIKYSVKGVKVFSITQSILRAINIWLPSPEEQTQIATFLDHETAKIDKLIDLQLLQIELLKERRTALISAAVTGKIDVRDWQVPVTQTESDEVMA